MKLREILPVCTTRSFIFQDVDHFERFERETLVRSDGTESGTVWKCIPRDTKTEMCRKLVFDRVSFSLSVTKSYYNSPSLCSGIVIAKA
jgi:hypothetical protein